MPRRLRDLLYQAAFLAIVVATAVALADNAAANLRARGVSLGFSFLSTEESNFVISETAPIPEPNAALGALLLAVAPGAVAMAILSWRSRARGAARRDDRRLRTLAWILLVGLPGLVLWWSHRDLHVIRYNVPSTYRLALLTGLANTLKLSGLSIVFGTLVGTAVGIARLSSNWLVRTASRWFVEVTRNVPLLLQLFFWYFGVLRALPAVRESYDWGNVLVLNNRGVWLPRPVANPETPVFVGALFVAAVIAGSYVRYARTWQDRTGRQRPLLWPSLAILVGVPLLASLWRGAPVAWEHPVRGAFNYEGGVAITPEFAAMFIGLVLYAAGFIAEIVRSGIEAVPRAQMEAALGVGLTRAQTLRLVILPQARRAIIPPLTSTYLGTIKDSALGVAVGYPELVSVGGTILDASGQALEILGLTILFYMMATLVLSAGMRLYETRVPHATP